MRVLIVGCGYVGVPLGEELVRQGHEVWGMRRTDNGRAELERAGITPLIADITDLAGLLRQPATYDWVVNCVSAGVVETEALDWFPNKEQMLKTVKRTPAQRLVEPKDMAAVVSFLCSPDAAMICGQTLIVDGGYSLSA